MTKDEEIAALKARIAELEKQSDTSDKEIRHSLTKEHFLEMANAKELKTKKLNIQREKAPRTKELEDLEAAQADAKKVKLEEEKTVGKSIVDRFVEDAKKGENFFDY